MPDATGSLTSCLCHCQKLSWSHDTAATDTSRPRRQSMVWQDYNVSESKRTT